MSEVMTVLGPVDAAKLGTTLPHEHLFCDLARVTYVWEQRLTEVALAVREAEYFADAGGRTIVDVTSRNLGRNPEGLVQVAKATGLNIVMGCGWYREPYYDEEVYEKSTNELADGIVREIDHGVRDSGIRPGIIGEIGCWRANIAPSEERSFRAAARAHKATGLTITTHAAHTPVGLKQLDLLEDEGVDLRRVIVGHCDTHPEADYHEAIAKRGAWVEFDFIRGIYEWEMEKEVRLITEFVRRGYLNQLLLSHDVCMKTHLKAYKGGGYEYLLARFVPRLLGKGITQEEIDVITRDNPRRALSGSPS